MKALSLAPQLAGSPRPAYIAAPACKAFQVLNNIMSLSFILLSGCIVLFALQGYWKGFIRVLSQLCSLLAAYAATFLFIAPLANYLRENTSLHGMAVYPVAGLLIFIPVSMVVTLLFSLLDQHTRTAGKLSALSRLAGLLTGAVIGALVGILLVYGWTLFQDFRKTAETPDSPLAQLSRELVSKTGARLINLVQPDAALFAEGFLHSPVDNGKRLANVAQMPELKAFIADPQLSAMVREGDTEQIMADPLFQQIADHPDLQILLQQSGLTDKNSPPDKALANLMVDANRGMEKLYQDPQVQAIMKDPEFQRLIEQKAYWQLMNDPRFPALLQAFGEAVRASRAETEIEEAGSTQP